MHNMLQTQETESVMKLCWELLIDAIDKHGTKYVMREIFLGVRVEGGAKKNLNKNKKHNGNLLRKLRIGESRKIVPIPFGKLDTG